MKNFSLMMRILKEKLAHPQVKRFHKYGLYLKFIVIIFFNCHHSSIYFSDYTFVPCTYIKLDFLIFNLVIFHLILIFFSGCHSNHNCRLSLLYNINSVKDLFIHFSYNKKMFSISGTYKGSERKIWGSEKLKASAKRGIYF